MNHSRTRARAGLSRRAMIAGGAAMLGAKTATMVAQTPIATPAGTPMASPFASPSASPIATPGATPVTEYPLDIVAVEELPDDGTPIDGGTLRLPVDPVGLLEFVPAMQRQSPTVVWAYLDALVRIDPATGSPAPGLATSWTWSDDGMTLTFRLRRDVEWHDGTPFTAEDARFTHLTYRDDYRSVIAGQTALVTDITAVNDTTLRVEFSAPDGAWLFNVASLPVVQARQYRDWWERNPKGERTLDDFDFHGVLAVGTGPWKLESTSLEAITLVRNEAYFEQPPHADRLELIPEAQPDVWISRWQDGAFQIAPRVDPQRVDDLLQTDGRLIVTDAPRTLFAAFNFSNPNRYDPAMLAELPLRQALSLALDRERYAEEIWSGFLRWREAGLVAQRWADASESNPDRDLSRAKALLADANWVDLNGNGVLGSPLGDSLVLTTLVLDTAEPAVIETLDAMHADLQEIGVSLAIERLPLDQFVTRWSADRTWDLLVYDLQLYPAFAEFDLIGSQWDISSNAGGWNPGGYANADADAALQAYFAAVTPQDMRAALGDVQRAIVEDPFALWLGFPQDLVLTSPDVRGFTPNPLWPTYDTRTLWLDPADE